MKGFISIIKIRICLLTAILTITTFISANSHNFQELNSFRIERGDEIGEVSGFDFEEDFNDVSPVTSKGSGEIFSTVDQPAEFPGGQAKLMTWLSTQIRYPESAQQNGVQGKVIVKFVIEKDGSISGVSILKGIDKDLDAEAIRVVKMMPKWKPGKNNGEPVRSYFTFPVTFKLSNQ